MKQKIISLQHGSGGAATNELLDNIIFHHLKNPILAQKHDGALLNIKGKVAFSTDSFVISPIFFKGGNIGELAVNGTVNDLAMCGAIPKYISLSFIIEEGFDLNEFEHIVKSIKKSADSAKVCIVTGDTKVVERGKGDKIYINTSGIGEIHPLANIATKNIQEDDVILINAPIASHGMAIMTEREGLQFESDIKSDTKNLNFIIKDLLDQLGSEIHFLRDATRGGLGSVLHEILNEIPWGIQLFNEKIKILPQVEGACELLGLDPLHVANEGVFLSILQKTHAQRALKILKKYDTNAQIIGNISLKNTKNIIIENSYGSQRIVNLMIGEQLPRIC